MWFKYLGHVNVQESYGLHVCEQAIQALLNVNNKIKSFLFSITKWFLFKLKEKCRQAVLHIFTDALRIIDHKNKLKGDINSIYHDGPLTVSKDGKIIYFSRNNFNNQVLGKNDEGITNLKIYKAVLVDGKWTNIEELPFNSNDYSTAHPALNSDETKLWLKHYILLM